MDEIQDYSSDSDDNNNENPIVESRTHSTDDLENDHVLKRFKPSTISNDTLLGIPLSNQCPLLSRHRVYSHKDGFWPLSAAIPIFFDKASIHKNNTLDGIELSLDNVLKLYVDYISTVNSQSSFTRLSESSLHISLSQPQALITSQRASFLNNIFDAWSNYLYSQFLKSQPTKRSKSSLKFSSKWRHFELSPTCTIHRYMISTSNYSNDNLDLDLITKTYLTFSEYIQHLYPQDVIDPKESNLSLLDSPDQSSKLNQSFDKYIQLVFAILSRHIDTVTISCLFNSIILPNSTKSTNYHAFPVISSKFPFDTDAVNNDIFLSYYNSLLYIIDSILNKFQLESYFKDPICHLSFGYDHDIIPNGDSDTPKEYKFTDILQKSWDQNKKLDKPAILSFQCYFWTVVIGNHCHILPLNSDLI